MQRRRHIRGRKKTLKGNRPNTPGGAVRSLTLCILDGAPTATTWNLEVIKPDGDGPTPGFTVVPIIASAITDLSKFGVWSDIGISTVSAVVPNANGTLAVTVAPTPSGIATLVIPAFLPSLRSITGDTCAGGAVQFVFT